MNKLIFTNKAVDDLSSIWEYTVRTWSASQAERYYNRRLTPQIWMQQAVGSEVSVDPLLEAVGTIVRK